MKVVLLRVGIDSGSGGAQGPLFQDGTFEYVPIPDGYGGEERTYGNTLGRYGRYLVDYLPPYWRGRPMRHTPMHVDPEFSTFTYGDPTPPKAGLRYLAEGDLLVFYCGLQGWGFSSPPALYIMGYLEVLAAGKVAEFRDTQILFSQNAHVRHPIIFQQQTNDLVLIRGTSDSRLLKKAVCISEMGQDRLGKPLKVLSREMQEIFGDFGGHISIQRSPPRWVEPRFVEGAAAFVRSLS